MLYSLLGFTAIVAAIVIAIAAWREPNIPSAWEETTPQHEDREAGSNDKSKGYPATTRVSGSHLRNAIEQGEGGTERTEKRSDEPLTITEADLLAQERVAHWTGWIGVLTALGFGAIVATFIATLFGIAETRRVGMAETRAYLVIETVSIGVKHGGPAVRITIRNNGNTPANDVEAVGKISMHSRHGDVFRDRLVLDFPHIASSSKETTEIIFGSTSIMHLMPRSDPNVAVTVFMDIVAYGYDVFGTEIVATQNAFVAVAADIIKKSMVELNRAFDGVLPDSVLEDRRKEHQVHRHKRRAH